MLLKYMLSPKSLEGYFTVFRRTTIVGGGFGNLLFFYDLELTRSLSRPSFQIESLVIFSHQLEITLEIRLDQIVSST